MSKESIRNIHKRVLLFTSRTPVNIIINMLLVYLLYMVCRLIFILDNQESLAQILDHYDAMRILKGATLFDLAGICYTNILYIFLVLLPWHGKGGRRYMKAVKWVFLIVNCLGLAVSLMDSAYFTYTHHRVTSAVFNEFSHESNVLKIIGVELVSHWYNVLIAVIMFYALYRLYRPMQRPEVAKGSLKRYYIKAVPALAVALLLSFAGMRGCRITTATRPLSVNDAMTYIDDATGANVVLNTPFCLLRTISRKPVQIPTYYTDRTKMAQLYTPLHMPLDSTTVRRKNVVILIVESFAQEFVGALNTDLDGGRYHGYTPFVDSLLSVSLSYEQSLSNGGVSIDAMPSVLASIPKMNDPFVLSAYSLNHISGIAHLLKEWGYTTAFFHGAENGSMGFQSFARSAGFERYMGRTEYDKDTRFGGDKDFDGTWAIWDEEYLQHFCLQTTSLREPFLATVFTASSHHPYAIPARYKDTFKDEGLYPLHKCIRYADYSLRRYFAEASKQPWYKNTIFIITADHASSRRTHDVYKTAMGDFRIPILFFDPSGEMPRERRQGIIQQIDIMPTVLSWLGYDRPFFAFGKDVLHTKADEMWAMNWDHQPQYVKGDYLLQHNGTHATALYNYRKDPLLRQNLINDLPDVARDMALRLEAFMQTYDERMKADDVRVGQKAAE